MWVKFLCVACAAAVVACNGLTFRADGTKEYPRRVKSASRLETSDASCDTIGTLVFDDGRVITDLDVETIANKAAAVGGTHYIIRDRSTRTKRGRERPTTGVVVVLVCTSGVKED